MPANNNSMAARFHEVAAIASVQRVVKNLHDLATDPSGKRYGKTADTRRAEWAYLAEIAKQQVEAISRTEKAAKAPRKPKSTETVDTAATAPISA